MSNTIGPAWLTQRFEEGDIVVIDGAMGTELEARGVEMHGRAWSATAILSNPDVVRAAHVDYIKAGAEVIITNTFSSARHMLALTHYADQVEAVNSRAVALAKEAVEQAAAQPVAVAGSICEWVHADSGWASLAKLRESLAEQAELLAEAGVDLLTIEMGQRPVETSMAIEVALSTGLPVWAGLSCKRDPATGQLGGFDRPGRDRFDEVLAGVVSQPVGVISVMHSEIGDTVAGIDAVRRQWSGPLGVYPESGHFKMPNWQFEAIIAPNALVEESKRWVERGVTMVGGCCGLSVPHIEALRAAYPR